VKGSKANLCLSFFAGRGEGSSIRSSQSSTTTYSLPSSDSDIVATHPEKLCDAEIEELFEKMLVSQANIQKETGGRG
jgi:hypothetical protein